MSFKTRDKLGPVHNGVDVSPRHERLTFCCRASPLHFIMGRRPSHQTKIKKHPLSGKTNKQHLCSPPTNTADNMEYEKKKKIMWLWTQISPTQPSRASLELLEFERTNIEGSNDDEGLNDLCICFVSRLNNIWLPSWILESFYKILGLNVPGLLFCHINGTRKIK